MMWLRQSTASQEISIGQFLDSTDGDTEEGGLTIANTDIKIRKGGTTTLANKTSGGATVISNGVYSAVLDATDTNTLGQLEIYVHVAGALATKNTYMVLPAATYDALVTNGLNDIAATDIVSSGAITTLTGAVVNVDLVDTLTTYTSNTPQTADHTAGIADVPTVAEFNARTLLAASYFDPIADTVANVTTVATTSTVTGGATSAAQTTAQNDLDIITGATGVNLLAATQSKIDAIPTTAMRGTDSALLAASINLTAGAVDNVTTVATTTTNTDMRGTDSAATPAQVNAEVLDVFTVDTFVEPSGVPAATSSLKDKIVWLFTLNRNKVTQTATTQTLRNDADAADIATSTVSDDATTFTRNEYI